MTVRACKSAELIHAITCRIVESYGLQKHTSRHHIVILRLSSPKNHSTFVSKIHIQVFLGPNLFWAHMRLAASLTVQSSIGFDYEMAPTMINDDELVQHHSLHDLMKETEKNKERKGLP